MRILNLYAGLGANRHLWSDEHAVVAVEKDPAIAQAYSDKYPDDEVLVEDAIGALLDIYRLCDFIWASPPCQSHSRMLRSGRNRAPRLVDMSLWQVILFCTQHAEVPWCVENVVPSYGAFVEPTAQAGRHLFWSNYPMDFPPQVDSPKNLFNRQNLKAKAEIEDWLGIGETPVLYYDGNHDPTQVLRNCLHPEIGKWALECAI